MMHSSRREFLAAAAAGMACATALRSAASEGLIEVLIDEPIATIAPEIYGHFVENLGGVVYDGIWVGENSAIPEHRRSAEGAGGGAAAHQSAGDPVAGRLLRR